VSQELQHSFTFVVPTAGNSNIMERNFFASPCFQGLSKDRFLIQRDFRSAAEAYNDAIERANSDLIIFSHQDMIFPESWLVDLGKAIEWLDTNDQKWGVLGCYGVTEEGVGHGYIYSPGRGLIGKALQQPIRVQTLDEIVLIIRRSSGLRFDPDLPHFHLYGTDICLRAAQLGMMSYAIPAFCIHNAHQYIVLPKEFYDCYRHIQHKWRDVLPVHTSCLNVTRSNTNLYKRRARELYLQIRRRGFIAPRTEDVPKLIEDALVEFLYNRQQ
jgi:hypothetical protein